MQISRERAFQAETSNWEGPEVGGTASDWSRMRKRESRRRVQRGNWGGGLCSSK